MASTRTARLGVTVFNVAVTRWVENGGDLPSIVAETLETLRAVAGTVPG